MKKFTLLIASLFISVGAMAQTNSYTRIADFEAARTNSTVYALKTTRSPLYFNTEHNELAAYWTSSSQSLQGSVADATATAQQFAFLRTDITEENKYYMYSVEGSCFITSAGAKSDTPDAYAYFVDVTDKDDASHLGLKLYLGTTGDNVVNATWWNSNTAGGIRYNTNSEADAGNVYELIAFDETVDLSEAVAKIEAFEARVEETLTYTLTDIAGNEFTGTYEGYAGEPLPAFAGAEGYTLTNENWDGTNYTATINFAYPVSNKEDGITNEVLLAQFGNKYWHAVGTNIKVQTEGVAAVDANCLWAIYPSFSEGVFTFEIMNVATGKYIHTDATAAAHNSEGTIVLSEISTEFVINSDKDFKIADKSLYISINSTNDTDVYLGLWGGTHNGTNVTSSTLPQYDAEITDAKYATFYAPVAVTVPSGVTAHTVTLNGEWATLSDPLATIPAYTGVVLYSETAATYTFAVTESEPFSGENALMGTVAATYITKDAYVLSYIDTNEDGVKDEVGFYIATTEGQADGTFLNNHHKAYLPKTTEMSAASYSFRFGEGTTGVEKVEIGNEKSEIYDLTGRRVETISEPGIYIVNGVKKLVR